MSAQDAKVKSQSQSQDVSNFYYTKEQLIHPKIEIGDFTYGKPRVRFLQGSKEKDGREATLKIGKFCSISNDAQFMLGGNHRPDWITTYPFKNLKSKWPKASAIEGITPVSKGDIIVGNDVWIAAEAMIMSGVIIGDGAVIGARTMVTQDVAPYAIVAGNPAREVKKRFDDKTIEELLAIKWWDWSVEKIERNADILSSPDVEKLKSCR